MERIIKRGKVFGKINWIDLLIVLFVIIIIIFSLKFFFFKNEKNIVLELQVCQDIDSWNNLKDCSNHPVWFLHSFSEGDEIKDSKGNIVGEIIDVKSFPSAQKKTVGEIIDVKSFSFEEGYDLFL